MADLVITAGSVLQGAGAQVAQGTAGATITAGQALYLDTTNLLQVCDPTFAGGSKAVCVGIALTGGSTGQPILYQTTGQITIGATVTVGETYLLSKNAAGKIMPVGDVVATNYVTHLGIGISATVINMLIRASGVQHA